MSENDLIPALVKTALDDDGKAHIADVFDEDVAPRLMIMQARTGNINCEFAGKAYKSLVERSYLAFSHPIFRPSSSAPQSQSPQNSSLSL